MLRKLWRLYNSSISDSKWVDTHCTIEVLIRSSAQRHRMMVGSCRLHLLEHLMAHSDEDGHKLDDSWMESGYVCTVSSISGTFNKCLSIKACRHVSCQDDQKYCRLSTSCMLRWLAVRMRPPLMQPEFFNERKSCSSGTGRRDVHAIHPARRIFNDGNILCKICSSGTGRRDVYAIRPALIYASTRLISGPDSICWSIYFLLTIHYH